MSTVSVNACTYPRISSDDHVSMSLWYVRLCGFVCLWVSLYQEGVSPWQWWLGCLSCIKQNLTYAIPAILTYVSSDSNPWQTKYLFESVWWYWVTPAPYSWNNIFFAGSGLSTWRSRSEWLRNRVVVQISVSERDSAAFSRNKQGGHHGYWPHRHRLALPQVSFAQTTFTNMLCR